MRFLAQAIIDTARSWKKCTCESYILCREGIARGLFLMEILKQ